ncbi:MULTISPECIES: NAD+ synthase [Halolamina]|uniref:NH(3)-dependent NAD(+) synthetase n=1 Tax=Halolamina pelagica TaxID=699431 RepID=A0A1I5Q6N7_9EURY|nr:MULTISPECIES: NAD+ synthase [Halolamina]NHX35110.1 NAD+ synthase [Halolamina sp. R1-12]SFP41641.1 NAD+ synthase [Halolamina pelagica]
MSEDVLTENAPLDLRFSEEELETARGEIVSFIEDTVDAAGAEGAVLGLSGGIDSTLTAYLAVEALGEEGLHGLTMPARVSDDELMSDAEAVAQSLGIPYDVIEIEPIAEQFDKAFPEGVDDRTAAGNVRVRTRAVMNYYVANVENRIVLGTGNRSEAMTGYFTKYGDQAVDCNPIGDLYKQQVRQLAAHVGVPHELVMQTPTAEMWAGQTDEEEMGLNYDHLDAVLALHVDGPLSKAATVRYVDGVSEDHVDRVVELVDGSAHKRTMPPSPGLSLSE